MKPEHFTLHKILMYQRLFFNQYIRFWRAADIRLDAKNPVRALQTQSFGYLVELMGVEPMSESASTQTSPGADGYCGLSPISLAIAQTVTRLWLSSFLFMVCTKQLRTHVLH